MASSNRPLDGKSAIVTGGSRGIGAAIASRLAADGAAVAITYAASAAGASAVVQAIEEAGGTAFAIQADNADIAALQSAVAQAARQFGGIDILVNNAGILLTGLIDNVTPEDFDRMINVNLRGMYFATQAAVKHMPRGGRVINIGSNVAVRSSFPGGSLYTLSKSAITAMGRALSNDLGPRGITINTVQPGPTRTDMTPGEGARAEQLAAMLPVRRLGEAEEVASLVAYLAGPASGFMTAAALTMDGGMSV